MKSSPPAFSPIPSTLSPARPAISSKLSPPKLPTLLPYWKVSDNSEVPDLKVEDGCDENPTYEDNESDMFLNLEYRSIKPREEHLELFDNFSKTDGTCNVVSSSDAIYHQSLCSSITNNGSNIPGEIILRSHFQSKDENTRTTSTTNLQLEEKQQIATEIPMMPQPTMEPDEYGEYNNFNVDSFFAQKNETDCTDNILPDRVRSLDSVNESANDDTNMPTGIQSIVWNKQNTKRNFETFQDAHQNEICKDIQNGPSAAKTFDFFSGKDKEHRPQSLSPFRPDAYVHCYSQGDVSKQETKFPNQKGDKKALNQLASLAFNYCQPVEPFDMKQSGFYGLPFNSSLKNPYPTYPIDAKQEVPVSFPNYYRPPFPPINQNSYNNTAQESNTRNTVSSDDSIKSASNRGSYKCKKCGLPKKGHQCKFADQLPQSPGLKKKGYANRYPKGRGNYKCGYCGVMKLNHICKKSNIASIEGMPKFESFSFENHHERAMIMNVPNKNTEMLPLVNESGYYVNEEHDRKIE